MYRIVWTTNALNQLQKILKFVINQQNSISYADKILSEIFSIEQYIIENPMAFIEVESTSQEVHKAVVLKHYSIFYSVSNNNIINIICFWDNRQDPENLKKYIK